MKLEGGEVMDCGITIIGHRDLIPGSIDANSHDWLLVLRKLTSDYERIS